MAKPDELVEWCKQQPEHAYMIAGRHLSITFLPCRVTSNHPTDVAQRFCARCHRFIDDVMLTEGSNNAEGL